MAVPISGIHPGASTTGRDLIPAQASTTPGNNISNPSRFPPGRRAAPATNMAPPIASACFGARKVLIAGEAKTTMRTNP